MTRWLHIRKAMTDRSKRKNENDAGVIFERNVQHEGRNVNAQGSLVLRLGMVFGSDIQNPLPRRFVRFRNGRNAKLKLSANG